MGHQCLHWAKQLYIIALQMLNVPILSLYMTSYQKLIFYSALIYRRNTVYHTVGIWINNRSYRREVSFLTYIRNCEQQHNIAVVKSTLKILPRHNDIIPIMFKGHNLKASMGYCISNQHINKELDPNIHVIDGILINTYLSIHMCPNFILSDNGMDF